MFVLGQYPQDCGQCRLQAGVTEPPGPGNEGTKGDLYFRFTCLLDYGDYESLCKKNIFSKISTG